SPPVDDNLLDATFTTAWATVSAGTSAEAAAEPIIYYSQPHGASLYANQGQAPAGKPQTLDFYQTKSAELRGDTDADSFPLVPYAGIANADSRIVSLF